MNDVMHRSLLVIVFGVVQWSSGRATEPSIETEEGIVIGRRVTIKLGAKLKRHSVDEYLGIPFAEPPVGSLRFKPPVKKEPWSTPLKVQTAALSCIQPKDHTFTYASQKDKVFPGCDLWNFKNQMSEDCLSLNIWTPAKAENLGVLVWLYGGGFYYGSPSLPLYNGAALAQVGNVIVVNVNYRVGALGFLYLGSDDAPGNMGLMDQQLALQWIQRNIARFGGNASNVVIFGESAGAASVVAHYIAKDSRPLFYGGILQSGSIQNPWATDTPSRALEKSIAFAKQGCVNPNISDGPSALSCLINLTDSTVFADQLWNGQFSWHFMEFPLAIVSQDYGGKFFHKNAFVALHEGDFKYAPLVGGLVQDEGTFWIMYNYYIAKIDKINKINSVPTITYRNGIDGKINQTTFADHFSASLDREPKQIIEKSKFIYEKKFVTEEQKSKGGLSHDYTNALNQMVGDYQFTCDMFYFMDKLDSHGVDVFAYHWYHRTSSNPWPAWGGVMHGYEIEFIFGVPLYKPKHDAVQGRYSDEEMRLSEDSIKWWSNFVKDGKPDELHLWPKYNKSSQSVKSIDVRSKNKTYEKFTKSEECRFWTAHYYSHRFSRYTSGAVSKKEIQLLLMIALKLIFSFFDN